MIAAQLAKLSHGGDRSKPQNCGLPAKDASKQLKVSTRSVETAKAVRKADPALAEEVKQGKTKLAKAAKIVAKRSPAKRTENGEAKKSDVEIKRHDERMKSARYKLEAFIRDLFRYGRMEGSYRGNQKTAITFWVRPIRRGLTWWWQSLLSDDGPRPTIQRLPPEPPPSGPSERLRRVEPCHWLRAP
jgi:cytochrome c556